MLPFISGTQPVQPCGTKADTLFSPYVSLKRALFDLKLIGQEGALGSLGMDRRAFHCSTWVAVDAGEAVILRHYLHFILFTPSAPSIHLYLYPCFPGSIFYLSLSLLSLEIWGISNPDSQGWSFLCASVLSDFNNFFLGCPSYLRSRSPSFPRPSLSSLPLDFSSFEVFPVKISIQNTGVFQQWGGLDPAESFLTPSPQMLLFIKMKEPGSEALALREKERESLSL